VTAYSGLFLRLNEPRNAPLEQGRDDRAAALLPSAGASHYFLLQGKILFCRDAERDFRKPGGTFSRAMAA
jgi:hypothetical protein